MCGVDQSKCKSCGMCCTAITFGEPYMNKSFIDSVAKREFNDGEYDTDCQFISEHWEQISLEEVFTLRPDDEFKELFGKDMYKVNWWRCKWFDQVDKKCKIHEIRPSVCRGFPSYHNEMVPPDFPWYTQSCGYRE